MNIRRTNQEVKCNEIIPCWNIYVLGFYSVANPYQHFPQFFIYSEITYEYHSNWPYIRCSNYNAPSALIIAGRRRFFWNTNRQSHKRDTR